MCCVRQGGNRRDGGKGCCEQICGVERGLLTSEHAGVDTLMCLVELQDWDSSGEVRVAEYSGES